MHFTAILLAALTGAVTVTANPLAASKTVLTPPTKRDVAKRQDCTIIPASPNSVSLADNPAFNRVETITFSIPAGFPGPCQLEAVFPAGFAISNSGDSQVNVIAVTGPAPGAIVGTTYFRSDPNQDTKIYINSFACQADMEYTLQLAGTEGAVDFTGTAQAGIVMAVGNCW